MDEIEKAKVLKAANIIFTALPFYREYQDAEWHWRSFKRPDKCKKCGKVCRTHLHHKDPTLKPDRIFWFNKVLEITFASEHALYEGPQSVVEEYLDKYKFEMLNTMRYWNVKRAQLIALCPKCHREAHKKYNDKNNVNGVLKTKKLGRPKKVEE